MTGTAREIAAELKATYDLDVLRVPTHRPSRRVRMPDRSHADDDTRWAAGASRGASRWPRKWPGAAPKSSLPNTSTVAADCM